jgi:hypothetical protein
LKVPYHTAHRWCLTGRLQAQRIEGHWYVEAQSVLDLERKRADAPPTPAPA